MIKNHYTLSKYRTPIFLVLALLVLYVISRYNYLLFHSFADGVSIVIAACVFTIIWNGRRLVDNDYYLYVGIAFLFFAFWDLMHLLGNKNMGVFPKYGNLGPALYIVSRYILSISLLIAPLFIKRKLNTTLMYAAYSILTLLILLSIFYWNIFPICIVEGVGLTTFKIVSDYIICMILLGAIGLLLFNRRSFDSRVLSLIVSSITLSIATGLAFTLYADPFGIMNAIGHFFQIASFYLIYIAFIETSLTKPQDILYQKLKQNEERLAESVKQLNDVNAELKQEIAERKRTEQALREKEEEFRLLFENMIEGVALHELIYDEQGKPTDYRILNANHAYEIHTGISVERARGSLASEFYSTAEAPYLAEYTRVTHTGMPLSFETYFPPLEKYFFISVIPHGRDQFATVFMDITDRKQSEDEVRLNEARLTSLLNISQYKAESIQELLDFALNEAIMLTGSRIGYIYFYDDQKKEFTLNTWSKDVMKECSIAEPQTIYQLGKTGLWGEAVRLAKPILVNDFQAAHPLKRGYPKGHEPLHKFLTLPIFSDGRIVAVVAVANKQTDYDESDIRQLDLMMSSGWKIADRKRVDKQLQETLDSLRKAVGVTIQVMVSAVETRDPYTSGHQIRSADLARAIATEMGLPLEKIEGLRMAASIHDIGKLSIPAEILAKPTKLSEIEFSLIKEHARQGYEILKNVESPWPLAQIVYQHHEWMDGSGYPRNLKGDEILMEARILAVADVVESMASHRPYRPALGIEAALDEISKNRGVLYDPGAVDACLRLFRERGFTFSV